MGNAQLDGLYEVKLTTEQFAHALLHRRVVNGRVCFKLPDCTFGMELSVLLEVSEEVFRRSFGDVFKTYGTGCPEEDEKDLLVVGFPWEYLVGGESPIRFNDEQLTLNGPSCAQEPTDDFPSFIVTLSPVQYAAVKLLSKDRAQYFDELKARVAPAMSDQEFTSEIVNAGEKIDEGLAWEISIVYRGTGALVVLKPSSIFYEGASALIASCLPESESDE